MENGYSICMNEWALDKEIKNELGLLLIISSLCAEKGYCYASNKYLGELFDLPEQTISRKIKKLEDKNYIKIEYKKRGCEIILRSIRLTKMLTDDKQKCESTINKNVKENIISNKNTSNNKEKIYKKELEIEFEEIWKHYPKKVGKSDSFKKYIKARKDGVSKEKILKAVIVYAEQNKTTPSKFIKHGKTWFNGEYWNDEIGETEEERMERLQREIEEEERNEERWI